jgi:hypothetical protein
MELNGALSNPFVSEKSLLMSLDLLQSELLQAAADNPCKPRTAPPKPTPVLDLVILVLTHAGYPMRACEIHAAAEQAAGTSLLWPSVKAALAAGASGNRPRFRRVRRGVYTIG